MKHSSFSPARIWTLATATLTQLVRMKILSFLVLFCFAIVALGFAFPAFNPEQQLKQLKDWSFAALQLYSLVIAIVATSLLLPRDLEDRTLYTILSKPVPRLEYLLGKLIGVLLLIGGGLVMMDVVFSAVMYLRQGVVFNQSVAALKQEGVVTPEALAQLQAFVGKQGLTWSLQIGVLIIFLKAAVITSMTLMISCFASSTLFTIAVSLCMVIIGHGQALIREYFLQDKGIGIAEKIGSVLLAILAPDLGNYDVLDNLLKGEVATWASVQMMLSMTAIYLVGYGVVSHLLFVEKEL